MEFKKRPKNPVFKALRKNIKGFIKEDTISESTLTDVKAACLSDPGMAKEIDTYLYFLLNKFDKKNKTEKLQKVVRILELLKNDTVSHEKQQESSEQTSTESSNSTREEIEKGTLEKTVANEEKKDDEKEKDLTKDKEKEPKKECRWKDKMKGLMKDKHEKKDKKWKEYKKDKKMKEGRDFSNDAQKEEWHRHKSLKKCMDNQELDALNTIFEEVPFKNCSHSRFVLGDKPDFPNDVDFVFIDKPVTELNSSDFKRLEEEICSFLNTRGGRIFFGINSDRVVVGDTSPVTSFQKVALKIALAVVDGFYPTLQPKHIKIGMLPVRNSDSHHLLRIDVQGGEKFKLYCTQKGKYFYRNKGELTKYSPQEVQDIIASNAITVQKKAMKQSDPEGLESYSSSEEEVTKEHQEHKGKHFKHFHKHGKDMDHGHHFGRHGGHHFGHHHGGHFGHHRGHHFGHHRGPHFGYHRGPHSEDVSSPFEMFEGQYSPHMSHYPSFPHHGHREWFSKSHSHSFHHPEAHPDFHLFRYHHYPPK